MIRPRLVAAALHKGHVDMTTLSARHTPLALDARGSAPDVTGVPVARTIERLAIQFGTRDGVMLRDLQPGTVVNVITRHTTYRLLVLDGVEQRVTVSGGRFPEGSEVRVDGATAGGSLLKAGWIGIGLCLELCQDRRRILTSRVRSLSVVSGPRSSRLR